MSLRFVGWTNQAINTHFRNLSNTILVVQLNISALRSDSVKEKNKTLNLIYLPLAKDIDYLIFHRTIK